MTVYRYLPVIGGSHFIQKSAWWRVKTSDGIFPYKYALASFHYSEGFTREDYKFPKGFYFFGDSGGFSVVTTGAVINPVEVYRWQEQNCQVGVILDMPPYTFSGSAQFGGNAAEIIEERLDQTKRNIEMVLKYAYKPKSKFKWWGVIQGETHRQRKMWYDGITSLHKFKGYALSPKPSYSWFEIVSHLLFAHKHKIKEIHILQISSVYTISLLMYVNKILGDYFKLITFDSATPIQLSKRGAFYVFNEESVSLDIVTKRVSSPICDCELCSQFNYRHKHWGSKENILVRITHTVKAIVQVTQFLEKQSKEFLAKFLRVKHKEKEFDECNRLLAHYLATGELLELKQHNNYIQPGLKFLS